MARYIEQGKSIFIPFHKGVSITDSQLHLRMYKTEEMFKRYGYTCGEVDVLCEYAPVVRCKDCKQWSRNSGIAESPNGHCFCHDIETNGHDYCSYGERRVGE